MEYILVYKESSLNNSHKLSYFYIIKRIINEGTVEGTSDNWYAQNRQYDTYY